MSESITTLTFEKPLEIKATIAFTMTIAQWEVILADLDKNALSYSPTFKMKEVLRDAIGRAKATLKLPDAAPPPPDA